MAGVYWIGVFLGLGLAIGVLLAGLLGASRAGFLAAIAVAAVAGFLLGIWLGDEPEAASGAIGGIFGAASAGEVVRGALRRGGARLGTALLVAAAAAAVALLALVPLVGYVETLALPLLAARMRRRQPERYAGLRTLARD
jgi:hypothetical protein